MCGVWLAMEEYSPAYSDEPVGRLNLRTVTNVATGATMPHMYLGCEYSEERKESDRSAKAQLRWWHALAPRLEALPAQFPEAYLYLTPDIAATGAEPAQHYVAYCAREGRRFRRG